VTQPQEPGYEQTRDELVAVVQQLEAGGLTLEESLELWQRGEELAATCQRLLEGAQATLDAAGTEVESPDASAE
jgi:exodeoxyribonuclease VII small subunit